MLLTDSLSGLKRIESESVQVCVTSPPFYLLRNYGTNPLTWPDGWEGELGHEAHPNDFIRHLLVIFDEVWRVLKDDGIMTVMFTHKDTSAWDALTKGLIEAGFIITASWPVSAWWPWGRAVM